MLPPEVLHLVLAELVVPQGGQLVTVCQLFYQHFLYRPRASLNQRGVCYLLNKTAWDGNVHVMKWAFQAYHIRLPAKFEQFPAAFSLEQGHVAVLDYLYSSHLDVHHLHLMNKSLRIAMINRHTAVLRWVLDYCERQAWTKNYLALLSLNDLRQLVDAGEEYHFCYPPFPFPEKRLHDVFPCTFLK